jgi:hypothetical protein
MTDMNTIVEQAMVRLKATAELTPEQEKALREVIVSAVIEASQTTSKTAAEVVRTHKTVDPTEAARLGADIEGSIVALIANLEAMR